MSNLNVGWTDERIESLKALWAEGLSASQIAVELGGITRNAVIGKANRIGLTRRAKATPARSKPRQRQAMNKVNQHTIRRAKTNTGAAQVYEEPVPEIVEIEIPLTQRRTLAQLGADTCRWPVGDPSTAEFFFCGGAAASDAPYCTYHCSVAFRAATSRVPAAPKALPITAY